MNWPLPQDFNEAIQNPAAAFSDPDLRDGETVTGPTGVPLPLSGNFADVYQLRGPDGRNWAVKCFTRSVTGLAQRYAQIAVTLAQARFPFTVQFTYLTQGIRVRGTWRPAIKMEWVEGTLLNEFVELSSTQPAKLATLAHLWSRLSRKLRKQGIAHADIQHGNILLVPGSRSGAYDLKLIDYDGMYIPTLAHSPSGEAGHPNYQHPLRGSSRAYSPDLDRFPNLVVATALKALEVLGPGLWQRYDTGDNLLFVESDFKKPWTSPLIRELWESGKEPIQALVGHLVVACGQPIAQTPWLDEIAPGGNPRPLDSETARAAAELLGTPSLGLSLSAPAPATFSVPAPPPVSAPAFEPVSDASFEPVSAPAFEPVSDAPFEPVSPPMFELGSSLALPSVSTPAADQAASSVPVAVSEPVEVDYVEVVDDKPERRRRKRKRKDTWEESAEEGLHPWEEPNGWRDLGSQESTSAKTGLYLGIGAVLVLVPAVIIGAIVLFVNRPGSIPTGRPPVGPNSTPPVTPGEPVVPGPAGAARPGNTAPNPWIQDLEPNNNVPAQVADLKWRWSVKLVKHEDPLLVIDPGTDVIVYGQPIHGVYGALSLQTGQARTGYTGLNKNTAERIFGIGPGQFGTVNRNGSDVWVWQTDTGQFSAKYPLPQVPPGTGFGNDLYVRLSPDTRYAVTARNGRPGFWYTGLPFRLIETRTGRTIQSFDWNGGSVHFTEDSTRVLVADYNGRFQWYRLPGGEAEAGWAFDTKAVGQQHIVRDISQDGGIIAYSGRGTSEKNTDVYPRLLDGRNGAQLRGFPSKEFNSSTPPSISADGRVAAIQRVRRGGDPPIILVMDTTTGTALGQISLNSPFEPTFTLSADGRSLVFYDGINTTILVYDVPGAP